MNHFPPSIQLLIAYGFIILLLALLVRLRSWRGRGLALVCALVMAVLILIFSTWTRQILVPFNADEQRRDFLLTGDEPAYLMTALSLARDGDTDVANNSEAKDYLIYQHRPYQGSGFSFYNKLVHGRISGREQSWGKARYMRHRPGTSVLIAPVFFLAHHNHRFWAYTLLSFCFACFAAIAVYSLGQTILPPTLALLLTGICGLAPPVYFYLNQIYPELPAGILLTAMALLFLLPRRPGLFPFFLAALVIWFSDRTILATLILCAGGWFGLAGAGRKTAAVLILGCSGGLFAWYCWHRFGVPWPVSHNTKMGFSPEKIPVRLLQIFCDGKQGWVWLFPPALLLPVMIWQTLREQEKKIPVTALVLALISVLILVAAFDDWQGGTNPRGRYYVIPQLLFLVLAAAWVSPGGTIRQPRLWWLIGLGGLALTQLFWLAPNPKWWFARYHPLFTWKAIQPWYAFIPQLPDNAPRQEWLKLFRLTPLLILPSLTCFLLPGSRRTGRFREGTDQ